MAKRPNSADPLDVPWARDSIQQATTFATNAICQELADDIEEARGIIESPLEAVFYAWFSAIVRTQNNNYDSSGQLSIQPQQPVENPDGPPDYYQVDFIIRPGNVEEWSLANDRGLSFPRIAVEVDGHDFHERTKEQVAYRDKRDRDLTRSGFTVFHFSGSVLHKDPESCAREVFDFADKALAEMNKRLYRIRLDEEQRRVKPEGRRLARRLFASETADPR